MKWPEGEPERAFYVCAHCDAVIEDADRPAMVRAGEWRATAPFKGIAGFHIWEAYSPWRTLAEIVTDFLAAKDHPELLKVWVNTSLGESWEDRQGETLDKSSFRREEWNADEIPAEVVCCTAGVDVQDDRLEASIVGWCEGQRARVVAHHILYGSPGQAEVWASLDRLLGESYPTADGRRARVLGTCVDSGGHHTQAVYRYTTGRSAVYAIKGMAGAKPAWPAKVSKSTTHKHGRVWVIGVDTIKDWLRGALAVKNPELPHHVAFAADLDDDYFAQLLVEKRVVKYSTAGVGTRTWTKPKGARNEAWDALVYAFAALEALKVMRRLKLVAPRKPEVNEEAKPATRRIGRIGGMGR